MKPKKMDIKVCGVTEKMKNSLEEISYRKFGKTSLSNTIKEILRLYIVNYRNPTKIEYDPNNKIDCKRMRMEIRINSNEYAYLQKMAAIHETSSNQMVVAQLRYLMERNPILSDAEIKSVRLSNIRLQQIGRNLNQIAKQLNNMGGTLITTQYIDNLHKEINQHIQIVGKLISSSKNRYELENKEMNNV